DSGALPVGSGLLAAVAEGQAAAVDAPVAASADGVADGDDEFDTAELGVAEHADEYELVEDTAGLEPGEDPPPIARSSSSRRRRYDSAAADAVSARKYKFRRRVLVVMALILVGSATAAFAGQSFPWRVCGLATGVTVLYLAYLRRQTRIEEQLRRRRMQRLSRTRFGTDNAREHEFDGSPLRSRHPDADLLEIDDEDPMLERLGAAMYSMRYGWPPDLPRAAGQ
ncbi:MAG: hypothetical protein K2Q25_11510, partial [Mycobacteriaceae bacterium]|nr:hypothetical protein [Mycobacteriaceae bacterium]